MFPGAQLTDTNHDVFTGLPQICLQNAVFLLMDRHLWRQVCRHTGPVVAYKAAGFVDLDGRRFALLRKQQTATAEVPTHAMERLTGRELQIAQRVALGDCDKVIAYKLGISEYTVREHLRRIFHKLQVTKRTALVTFLFRNQMVG